MAQVFSCEFCDMFKNTFFIEHLQWLLLLLVEIEKVGEYFFSVQF